LHNILYEGRISGRESEGIAEIDQKDLSGENRIVCLATEGTEIKTV